MNTIRFAIISALVLLMIGIIADKAYSQSLEPLRYMPNISEDEVIICVKDIKHDKFFGQISCIISDDGLDNPVLKKLGNKAMGLDDTFEMGLID